MNKSPKKFHLCLRKRKHSKPIDDDCEEGECSSCGKPVYYDTILRSKVLHLPIICTTCYGVSNE